MGNIRALAVCLSVLAMSTSSFAGVIFNSGSLHATATAGEWSGPPFSKTNTPPDVVLSGPSGSTSASVSSDTVPTVSASVSENFGMITNPGPGIPMIDISGSTTNIKYPSGGPSSSASASGTVVFNENLLQGFTANLSTGKYTSANITIKDAANNTVLSMSTSGIQSASSPVTFSPGAYTMTWSLASIFVVGTSGTSNMSFQVIPEPASMALLIMPTLAMRRKRHRL
jgi:hypothetical protein